MTSGRVKRRTWLAISAALGSMLLVSAPAQAAPRVLRIGGYQFLETTPPPACQSDDSLPIGSAAAFSRAQCVRVIFLVDGGGPSTDGTTPTLTPAPQLVVDFFDQAGALLSTVDVDPPAASDHYSFLMDPTTFDSSPYGTIRFVVRSTNADDVLDGQTSFQLTLNQLGTRTVLDQPSYAVAMSGLPENDLVVHGATWERQHIADFVMSDPTDPAPNPHLVAGEVEVVLTRKNGTTVTKNVTASPLGIFQVTFTAAEIGDVSATAADNFERAIKITSTATYNDPVTGLWGTATVDTERTANAIFETKPDRAQVRTTFVSERGWVAPGETYVHDVEYRNVSGAPAAGVTVTDTLPVGAVFVSATPAPDSVAGNTLTWNIGAVPAGTEWPEGTNGATRILVTARAKTTGEDAQIVYKDLSDTATIEQTGFTAISSTSHGPKVSTQETARYGDRPFPVVLVDYADFKHSEAAAGWTFFNRISSKNNPASLYRLYQDMSFTQLHPDGEVASFQAEDTGFAGGPFKWSNPYLKGNTCTGVTTVPPDPLGAPTVESTPAGDRIVDGWYQLPGERQYYGQDGKVTAITGSVTGVPQLQDLDSGCGPTSKSAYDAASIADPDLDYNEFDGDRNCVVDFFEIAFQGRGGNGDSQAHGYDNIWPHSGNLQDSFIDPDTGLLGYVSNDQCRDRLERPLWYTDESRSQTTTVDKGDALKAHSRVGPYNVNPENGTTSVFAHEYGHSLGLPDFYSTGSRTTADFWELMAQDGFQFMSIFARQDLGWIVPKRAPENLTTTLRESKVDTHSIDAIDADGNPYTLSGSSVHNGDAYYVELPHRTLVETVPSGKWGWYSGAGNSFGCPGHTLDVDLRATRFAPEGTAITLTMKSWYEIEWDFDYGFVLVSTDHGQTFTALPSENGRTTPGDFNPFSNTCQEKYGNGITGTSASPTFPANIPDRTNGDYAAPEFIDDSFDLSACAGKDCILRFAYSTDVGLAKRGWILDDIKVEGGGKTYFSDDVEQPRSGYGVNDWLRFSAGPAPFDHGYYFELRDRVSNDFDSAGQGERHPLNWIPGVSIWYTDEAHGYGNAGTSDPPAQSPLDPRFAPSQSTPRLTDASFYPLPGLNVFDDTNWTDNYVIDADDNPWVFKFDCFRLTVDSINGLGSEGAQEAGITMTTSKKNCVKVAGISQGKPKPTKPAPAPKKRLPATGVSDWPPLVGVLLLAAAASLRRRIHARA